MPTYEYRCPKGHEFEEFQRMSDPPEARCPVCGKKAERVLSGGAGVLFKGSGFYATDYRSESYKKAAESEKGGAPEKASGKDSEKGSGKDATRKSTGSGGSEASGA